MGKSLNKRRGKTLPVLRGESLSAANDVLQSRQDIVSKRHLIYAIAAAAAIITFIAYLPALQNGFVNWDDPVYVSENPHVRSFSSAFLRWAFFDFYDANWIPLSWISHALDYAIWGLNPLGHHLTNNVLHAANTFLVVLLIFKLLETGTAVAVKSEPVAFEDKRAILIAGGMTGLLFGLHPVHVESVAWVTERKDLLCTLFFLLSVLWYIKYAGSRSLGDGSLRSTIRRQYLISIAFFVLALLSKPMAVTLPAVLLILDWYPLIRIRSRSTLAGAFPEKLPFIALSLVSSILTIWAQKTGAAMQLMEVVPLSSRLLVAARALVEYLWHMIWPLGLVPFYPHPKDASIASPVYLGAILLVAGVTALCIVLAKKQKLYLSIWGYYVLTLLPVLGIVQVGGQYMADRYAYLPSIGPFLLMGLGLSWVLIKVHAVESRGAGSASIIAASFVLILGPATFLTYRQMGIWENSFTLWTHAIERAPEKAAVAYKNRGLYFFERGELDRAIEDDTEAIRLDPSYVHAYNNRGLAFVRAGRLDQAIADFNRAILLSPAYFEALANRGLAFDEAGQPERAVADYTAAISQDPSDYRIYYFRGLSFEKMGSLDNAIADFDRVVALNALDSSVYYTMALSCTKHGLFDRSLDYFNRAITLNQNDGNLWNDRGLAHLLLEHYDRALQDFDRAIELDGNNMLAYNNRGNLYLRTGDRTHAIADFERACDLGNAKGCANLRVAQRPMQKQGRQ